jgi:hypothetical protein
MDIHHEVGDFVIIKPHTPIVGKVVKVHENGDIVVKWPSGHKSYGPTESYVTVLSVRNAKLLD